ncbi:ATP F0F1 synthase subunit B [Devosia sp. RR2S18]|uniref:F0F1 ATP synthase subunit B family protein n=1 Tax=Devosia rhizosphaerae TaxID=3049774 RepID=UPI0025404A3A|nr:ATP F0F1 synthase subunit B [Devosia sp. RR2S18]WIJ24586.1 ATP F0F1 synthase subunit B [Devosia sp. RR2S18]
MVAQAFAQEPLTPIDETVVVVDEHGVSQTPVLETFAETEHHYDDGHSDVFPPFDPATFPSQLLWLAITFGALYLVMSRLALPRIGTILENRKARIDADLAAADASRQKTDAAIAAYEAALAAAKTKAQGIAETNRTAVQADIAAKRAAVEAELVERISAAEARIAQTKAQALTHVDEIAAETAQSVVAHLSGEVPPDSVRAAVAKVSKE